MPVNTEEFIRQVDCIYKEEHYSVRDNGAVLRHPRSGKALRKLDNKWTFGNPNSQGYMLIVTEVVHRIVGYAFLGDPPTPKHIIDHIDTNRQNNRPENLRWATKLENILNNPLTVNKIIYRCGSIDAFLKDPSILKNFESDDRNFKWMRTVTPEEAQISWNNLLKLANKKKNGTSTNEGGMGEWIYQDNENSLANQDVSELVMSLTPNSVQRNWKTPCEFPFCPDMISNNPIIDYASKLTIGEVFSRNRYSYSIIEDLDTSKDGNTIWVLCKSIQIDIYKPWSLAEITFEDNLYVHTNLGSSVYKNGVEKQLTLLRGLEWTGGEVFDELI